MISDSFQFAKDSQAKTRFLSTTALALNTPETIFSSGSNINGAVVDYIAAYSANAGAGTLAFTIGSSAPAAWNSQHAILAKVVSSTAELNSARPIFIPAGLGLYVISAIAESQGYRSVGYTLL